jgi:hypothetical protein
MKKMMFSLVAVAALALVSCGSKEAENKDAENKEGGPSVCDCVQWEIDYRKEKSDADGADEKKAVKEKYKEKEEKCEKMYDEATKEEKKKMREEAAKCK